MGLFTQYDETKTISIQLLDVNDYGANSPWSSRHGQDLSYCDLCCCDHRKQRTGIGRTGRILDQDAVSEVMVDTFSERLRKQIVFVAVSD